VNFTYLSLQVEAQVGYLTLKSPERFNILHSRCIGELRQGLSILLGDPDVRCVVLGGEGESFAVGANIAEMEGFGPEQGLAFSELGSALFRQMEEADTPIIGALGGIAMGGGLDLALACDIRLASDRVRIAHPGAKLGIITGFGGTQKLPRLIGRNLAREVFMTAAVYEADKALAMDLVDRVFPHEQFAARVTDYARHIAGQDPAALAYAKKLINAAQEIDLKNGQLLELGAFSTLFSSGRARATALAFLAG